MRTSSFTSTHDGSRDLNTDLSVRATVDTRTLGRKGRYKKKHAQNPRPNLPLITGVKTAMPSKFGSVTVLSRMSPPMLLRKEQEIRAD